VHVVAEKKMTTDDYVTGVGGWVTEIFTYFVSSLRMVAEQTALALHKELQIIHTWRANCQMMRSGQPTGVLIPVVYLFGGEESKAKNSKVAHEYAEHREHSEFILVRVSGE
jgi:hypothetical protein